VVSASQISAWLDYSYERKMEGIELVCNGKNPYMTPEKVAWLRELLLTAPEELLKMNKKAMENFETESLDSVVHRCSQENPLFLLRECSEGACDLSRINNPSIRGRFENLVVDTVVDCFADIGSGKGGLFHDAVILAKILEKRPDASLTVYLMNPFYLPYITIAKSYSKEKFDVMGDFSFDKNAFELFSPEFVVPGVDRFLPCTKLMHERFKQMVTFFKEAYPWSDVRFYLYGDAREWSRDSSCGFAFAAPDTIIGADFIDLWWCGIFERDELSSFFDDASIGRLAPINVIFLFKEGRCTGEPLGQLASFKWAARKGSFDYGVAFLTP